MRVVVESEKDVLGEERLRIALALEAQGFEVEYNTAKSAREFGSRREFVVYKGEHPYGNGFVYPAGEAVDTRLNLFGLSGDYGGDVGVDDGVDDAVDVIQRSATTFKIAERLYGALLLSGLAFSVSGASFYDENFSVFMLPEIVVQVDGGETEFEFPPTVRGAAEALQRVRDLLEKRAP